eukprot:scaffold100751_cov30-Tisochrysis_lutea.AAC.4
MHQVQPGARQFDARGADGRRAVGERLLEQRRALRDGEPAHLDLFADDRERVLAHIFGRVAGAPQQCPDCGLGGRDRRDGCHANLGT